jgi:hypothetical protein
MCLLVSGILRMFERFAGQLGWNNPDLYWNALLNLVDWFANVILPVYAGTVAPTARIRSKSRFMPPPATTSRL